MKESAEFGLNKTPTQLHPKMTKDMVSGYKEFPQRNEEKAIDSFTMRKDYIENSEPFGDVPVPSTIRGAVSAGVQAIKGNSPSVFIDKLGERLAFERSGVRLYDAFITKCNSAKPELSTFILEEFRQEELEHFALVRDCITAIGGDPTAQTPCADASGVTAMGLMQLITDPRSTIPQCLEAMLTAELTDVAGWDLLVKLVEDAGLRDFATKFESAKIAEDRHLDTLKSWLERMIRRNDVGPVVM